MENIVTGKSHYKTLRPHLLIVAALCVPILEKEYPIEELAFVHDFVEISEEDKLGSNAESTLIFDNGKG